MAKNTILRPFTEKTHISQIPGIGHKLMRTLIDMDAATIGGLQRMSPVALHQILMTKATAAEQTSILAVLEIPPIEPVAPPDTAPPARDDDGTPAPAASVTQNALPGESDPDVSAA
jgi:hypothetical protein